ncbi:hypothetical protein ACP4OV_009651 [Aristida adscensionis]
MSDRTKILSPIRQQEPYCCALYALAATPEPNLRVQWGKMTRKALSIKHLKKLDEDSRTKLPNEGTKIRRLLLMIQNEGLFEDDQYRAIERDVLISSGSPAKYASSMIAASFLAILGIPTALTQTVAAIMMRRLRASDARLYKISRFSQYQVDDSEDIKRALYQLRRGGPLLAVIKISKKYDKFYNTGRIYKFDPNTAVMNNNGTLMTHALSVVSFVLEAKVPCLECQDSHGQHFGKSGFLMVDVSDRTL